MQNHFNHGLLFIFSCILVQILNGQAMTSGMADGSATHNSSSSTSLSYSSSSGDTKRSTGMSYEERRKEIFRSHVRTLQNGIMDLMNDRMNAINSQINRIQFKNPFTKNGPPPSQQIVDDWQTKKNQLEDNSDANDYAKISNMEATKLSANSFPPVDTDQTDGWVYDPSMLPAGSTLAGAYNLTPSNQTDYNREDVYNPETNSRGSAEFEVADKAVDDLLDNIEPALGSRLKLIKDLGYKTVDFASGQINNFFDCTSGCVEKSEQLYKDYRNDVSNAFMGLIPGADTFKNIRDNISENMSKASDLIRGLF